MEAQKADFIIKDTSAGCVPLTVNFTDISSGAGGVVSRNWYLGYNIPGLQTDQPEVGTNYITAGTYFVTLKVRFANGDTASKTKTVVVHPIPVANFETKDTVGCSPLKVQFKDLSVTETGTITKWSWDLDIDGNTSNLQNPIQVYDKTGAYRIILFVENSWGCRSQNEIKYDYIHVINRPSVNFTLLPQNTCKDSLTVFFNNTSVNCPKYLWSFGDGSADTVSNPVHFYNLPGSYTVKLRSIAAPACGDSITRTVNLGSPKATITNTPATVCEGSNNTFTGNLSAGASGRWIFLDRNQVRNGNPVTYSFNDTGTYTILFIARNNWGCEDTARTTIFVKAGLKPLFTVDTARSCKIPFVVQAANLTQDRKLKFSWNFGDGFIFNGIDPPPHSYNISGNFTITLTATDTSIVNGCTAQISKPDIIEIASPSVSISPNPVSDCKPPKPFSFTAFPNFSIDPAIKYIWNFGDGSTDTTTGSFVTHIYNAAGSFPVSVTASSKNGCAATAATTVILNDTCIIPKPPDPVIFVTSSCNFCNSVTLKDTVSNNTVISWSISDGTFINTNVANPYTHLFPAANGKYTVTLVRRNNTSGDTSSTKTQVTIICIDPTFRTNKPVACINDSVGFTPFGTDSSQVYAYTWDFGDGSSRVLYNNNGPVFINGSVSHQYNQLGSYQVKLTVTDRKGCNRTAPSITVIIQGPKPNFTAAPLTSCDSSFIVYFKDSTALNANIPILKWQWTFGDGTIYQSSKDTIIPKRYRGITIPVTNYNVTLKVIDSVGCSNSVTKNNYVKLYRPKANLFSNDTVQCNRYTVFLASSSQAVNPTYTWYPGDGTVKNGSAISHIYPLDGEYDIKLVLKDENGCMDSIVKIRYVKFIHPHANMSIRDTGQCWPVQIRFFDSSQYASSYLWDFGDGRSPSVDKNPKKNYASPGIYSVRLVVGGPNGCKDTISQNVKIKGATGQLLQGLPTGCKPFDATMQVINRLNITAYKWDYGDGTKVIPQTADSVVTHSYKQAGKYLPNVVYVSEDGCAYSSKAKDTVIVDSVKAFFSATSVTSCDSTHITVTNLSAVPSFSAITKYSWDWGNGQSGNTANPIPPVYKQPGTYDIQLAVASKYGCRDTFRLPALVKIFSQPQLSITGKDSACQKTLLSFSGNVVSPDSVIKIKWMADNDSVGTGNTITIPFNTAGTSSLSLNVITRYGCNATIHKPITVLPLPVPNAGPDTTVCVHSGFRLKAFDGIVYTWTPAATLTAPDIATPFAKPEPGITKYIVNVVNKFGCAAKDSVTVKVDDSIQVSTITPVEICRGDSASLHARLNANMMQWSPANGLNNAHIPNPSASPNDTTLYTLVGFSNNSCPNDTGFVLVNVKPSPQVTAKASPNTTTPGKEVLLIAESKDNVSYQWSPASVLLNAGTKMALWSHPDTTTIFSITVKNQAGCPARADVEVKVICSESSVFVPNAFTPGGLNPYFRPLGSYKSNPQITAFSVFTRWGQRVYHTENSRASQIPGWDGYINGRLADPDTYVWFVQAACTNGTITKKGTVELIR